MAKFSRQHYEAVADAINDAFYDGERFSAVEYEHGWPHYSQECTLGVTFAKNRLIKLFQADNPSFRESVFNERCYRGIRE